MRITNISIRYKLLVSFIAIALLTLPMSLYTLTSTNRITHDFMNIVDYSFPRLQALLEMQMTANPSYIFC